jgi:uncharacterized protein with PQ loop repeat
VPALPALLPVLAFATLVVGLVGGVPQLFRLLRQRDGSGVSAAGLTTTFAAYVAWAIYCAQIGEMGQLLAMVVPGVAFGVASLAALRFGAERHGFGALAAMTGVLVLAGLVGGWVGYGLVLASTSTFSYFPSVRTAWSAPSLAGLSAPTWGLAASSGALWAWQGALLSSWPMMVGGGLGVVMPGAVLAAIALRRHARAAG